MESRDYIIQYKQDDQWRMHRLHYHEGIELMLVLTDGGDFFMDRKMYPLKKNTLFILNANTLHRDENGADGSVFKRYVLHILPSLLDQLSTPQTDFAEALKNSGLHPPHGGRQQAPRAPVREVAHQHAALLRHGHSGAHHTL